MNNLEANQRHSDHCYLTSMAWGMIRADIEKQIGRKLENWTGPEIVTEDGSYKLDWHAPDNLETELAEEYVTLYDDGVWQFYGKDGQIDGRVLRLHDRRWNDRMLAKDINGVIAWGSVQFFKTLKQKDKR